MFFDVNPEYTDIELNHKKNNPMVFERFIHKERNVLRYSNTTLSLHSTIPSNSYSFNIKVRTNKPASANLKRAMFRTSSKGIASALNSNK
jgi:hypothetical protein